MPPVKAAICHEFGTDLTLETIELRAPVKGEIEVTLGAVAICHSDISYIDGAWGGRCRRSMVMRRRALFRVWGMAYQALPLAIMLS